ncbi:hypothetical protein HYH03_012132 [Edaphochlamys debaryana]|uniref:protein-tyrosine-phosphatase n=1 Tax=Edaphochlamys debaryana TaxID=47281 RepID=A0A835XTB9_9CHLO|nr:hypothetical protein HYH03_012132 [Edaphochlamys debaryana]|eukprot:KAG2489300.1 hypothetical protein HYH03_012132 [Edaphochlamys debaryana]
MTGAVEYIEPQQLAAAIRHPSSNLVVVDVRDEDFPGGHIRGAVNIPAALWADQHIDGLIEEHRLLDRDMVVVHCMFSQQRGPRTALRLHKHLQDRGGIHPTVYVLRGGWTNFHRLYRGEKDLVELD